MRLAYRRPPRLDGFEEVIRGLLFTILKDECGVDVFELDGFLNTRILAREIAPLGATMRPPVDEGHCRALVAAAFMALVRSGAVQFRTARHSFVVVAVPSPKAVR